MVFKFLYEVTYQLLKYTFVQFHLLSPALPELLVSLFQTIPMIAEFLKTGVIDVSQADWRRGAN